jgi:hypothetical protein
MAEPVGVEMVVSNPDFCGGRWQNLGVLVWRGATTAEGARRATKLVRETALAHTVEGVAIAILLEAGASPPAADARAILAAGMRESGRHIRGVAYVVSAGGFAGAALRGAITGLSLLAREPYPTQVHADAPGASAWLAKRLGEGGATAPGILAAIERVRQG